MYEVRYTETSLRTIKKLPAKVRGQIEKACERLSDRPDLGKQLTGDLKGILSYRSGNYRILYQVRHDMVLVIVLAVGDRKNVYADASRKTGWNVNESAGKVKNTLKGR